MVHREWVLHSSFRDHEGALARAVLGPEGNAWLQLVLVFTNCGVPQLVRARTHYTTVNMFPHVTLMCHASVSYFEPIARRCSQLGKMDHATSGARNRGESSFARE